MMFAEKCAKLTLGQELDELRGKVRILECAVSGCKEGSRRNDRLIEDEVNMIDVKYSRKVDDLFDLVANLGSRVVELEKGKEEPVYSHPEDEFNKLVYETFAKCRTNNITVTFKPTICGLEVNASTTNGSIERDYGVLLCGADLNHHNVSVSEFVSYILNNIFSLVSKVEKEVKTDGSEENRG